MGTGIPRMIKSAPNCAAHFTAPLYSSHEIVRPPDIKNLPGSRYHRPRLSGACRVDTDTLFVSITAPYACVMATVIHVGVRNKMVKCGSLTSDLRCIEIVVLRVPAPLVARAARMWLMTPKLYKNWCGRYLNILKVE